MDGSQRYLRGDRLLLAPTSSAHGVVCLCRNVKDHVGPGFTLITIKGEQWTFASANADTITKLLSIFLDGLRRRSRWAIAIQDFIVQGRPSPSPRPTQLPILTGTASEPVGQV